MSRRLSSPTGEASMGRTDALLEEISRKLDRIIALISPLEIPDPKVVINAVGADEKMIEHAVETVLQRTAGNLDSRQRMGISIR